MLYHSERLAPTINEQQREAEDLAIQKECLKEYLKEIAQDLLKANPRPPRDFSRDYRHGRLRMGRCRVLPLLV